MLLTPAIGRLLYMLKILKSPVKNTSLPYSEVDFWCFDTWTGRMIISHLFSSFTNEREWCAIFWTCVFSKRDCCFASDAKAGGTAPNIAKITKHKMQTDEALKILGFEGRKSLNPQVLTEVRVWYYSTTWAIVSRHLSYRALFDHPKEYFKYDEHDLLN